MIVWIIVIQQQFSLVWYTLYINDIIHYTSLSMRRAYALEFFPYFILTYSPNRIHRTYQKFFKNSINLCGFLCVVALSWSLLLYLLIFFSQIPTCYRHDLDWKKTTNFLSTIRIVNGLCTHVICQIKTWIHPILLAEFYSVSSDGRCTDTNDKITTSIDCINSLDG